MPTKTKKPTQIHTAPKTPLNVCIAALEVALAALPKPPNQPPSPAPAVAPEPRPLSHMQEFNERQKDYQARAEKLKAMFAFFEDGRDLELFEYLQLIADHDHGCTTPVEEFITNLILHYGWADKGGHGLTVDHIESELETLKTNLADVIQDSHFIASRYARPQ